MWPISWTFPIAGKPGTSRRARAGRKNSWPSIPPALLPGDAFVHAQSNSWLFWEQYSHEPYIAVCRFAMLYQGKSKKEREDWRVERVENALDFMQQSLSGKDWFVDARFTIADISLLAYTRVAHEGGFDLASRPNVGQWIARCEARLGLES